MTRIVLIDTVGDSAGPLGEALTSAGWEVVPARDPAKAGGESFDAIVLATDAVGLASALDEVLEAGRDAGAPVVLVTDLDRSGWDRTFGASGGLGVDALFDKSADPQAVVERLKGILAARASTEGPAAAEMETILDRAIANEEAAAAFYRHAASSVADEVTRDALEGLMRDEEEHKRLIEEFRSGERSLPEGAASGGSLVEKFGTPDFSPEMAPADAFLLAARKEKLAFEFYENWAGLYPEGPERKLLMGLADIERRHKARVEAMFANAAFPEKW
jgi:rubrerythrin